MSTNYMRQKKRQELLSCKKKIVRSRIEYPKIYLINMFINCAIDYLQFKLFVIPLQTKFSFYKKFINMNSKNK